MKIGVVTGLHRETQCLSVDDGTDGLLVRCAGARPEQAETCAVELLEMGCRALISFGIAGGLSPEINEGVVVIANEVVLPDGTAIATADNWRERLLGVLPKNGSIITGRVAGSETLIGTPEGKAELYEATRAVAVDMESQRVAAVAAKAQVPLMVIRAISDSSSRGIPDIAIGAINKDGTPRYGRVIKRLMKQPLELPKLLRLSRDTESALASLRSVAVAAGPLFRFA